MLVLSFLRKLYWLGALRTFAGDSLCQIIELGRDVAFHVVFHLVKFIPQILFHSAQVFPGAGQISLDFA